MSVLVGILLGLAVLVLTAPPARRRVTGVGQSHPGGPTAAARRGRTTGRSALRVRGGPAEPPDLGALLRGVAAQLDAGSPASDAWEAVLGHPVVGGAPRVEDLVAAVAPGRRSAGLRLGRGVPRTDPGSIARVRAVVAGAGVAAQTGAPLAGVLADLADAVAADAEQAADVAAALAGPRATARVLVLLPVLGLAVGAAIGARPVQVLLAGGAGTVAGVVGCVLTLAGHTWVTVLLRRAGAG